MKRPWTTLLTLAAVALFFFVRVPVEGAPALTEAVESLVVRDVTVLDPDGKVVWRGDADLAPTLARIERGERDDHRGDGTVFSNREGFLPAQPHGFYREYVVRTPGLRAVGPQRVVLGQDGAAWYTSDHYRSFVKVRSAR